MLLSAIQSRLIARVNTSINNGEFTERSLARLVGVSQPQLHNVLKGARKLQTELADRLMNRFNIGVVDLLETAETSPELHTSGSQTCVSCPLGPGVPTAKSARITVIRKPPSREFVTDSEEMEVAG